MKLVISLKFVLTAGSPPVPNLPLLLLIFLVRSSVVRVKLLIGYLISLKDKLFCSLYSYTGIEDETGNPGSNWGPKTG